jgi:hypothetical protein
MTLREDSGYRSPNRCKQRDDRASRARTHLVEFPRATAPGPKRDGACSRRLLARGRGQSETGRLSPRAMPPVDNQPRQPSTARQRVSSGLTRRARTRASPQAREGCEETTPSRLCGWPGRPSRQNGADRLQFSSDGVSTVSGESLDTEWLPGRFRSMEGFCGCTPVFVRGFW